MRLLSLLVFLTLAPLTGHAERLAIGPVTVLSMQDGSAASDRQIVVENGLVVAVRDANQAVDASARQIDGQGAWVIPGLAEMHAHIPSRDRGEQYAKDILTLFLANGITTVRGMLGEPWHLELRQLLETQEWPGPRLRTSGPSFNGNSVTSPEQAAARARQQHAAGYDFLKLHPGLEPDEFQAIARTASSLGIPFGGHVSYAVGLDAALAAGQSAIDHLDGYAEQLVPESNPLHGTPPQWFGLNLAGALDRSHIQSLAAATARAGVWNVPTQSLFESTAGSRSPAELLAGPGMRYVGPQLRERWSSAVERFHSQTTEAQRAAFLQARRQLIRALNEQGAGLLLGSDAPQIMNVPGFSIHQELQLMVSSGLTPLQALQAGTINVARFFGQPGQGEVSPGMAADFVLLRADPRQDIGATRRIAGVVRLGRWYGRETLDEMLEGVASRGL